MSSGRSLLSSSSAAAAGRVQVSIVRLLVDVMPFLTFMTLMMIAFGTALFIVYHPYDGNVKYEFSSIPGVPSIAVRYLFVSPVYMDFLAWIYLSLKLISASLNVKLCIFKNHFT